MKFPPVATAPGLALPSWIQ